MKLYLVWNEDKTECVGFVDKNEADYALACLWGNNASQPCDLADAWVNITDNQVCTITEIEV